MNKLLLLVGTLIAFYLIYSNTTELQEKVKKVLSKGKECSSGNACKTKEQYINPIKFIDQVFTFLSKNDKIVLKNNCIKNSYITPNIPQEVEDEVDVALATVLHESNQLCCSYMVLRHKNLVLVEKNEQGERYIIDGVFHETVEHFSVRFVLDYVKLGEQRFINYVTVANSSVYNLRKHPANSSESCNNLAAATSESLGPMDNSQYDSDWSSRLTQLYNDKYKVIGIDDSTSLDSNIIDYVIEFDVFDMTNKNKWIVPFNKMGRCSDFCKKQSLMWDRFGANLPEEVGDGCLMHNTGSQERVAIPNINPNKVGIISEYGDPVNSDNAWLFNSGEFGNVRVETGIA